MKSIPKWALAWALSHNDPVTFVRDVLDIKMPEWKRPAGDTTTPQMEVWQFKVLCALRDGKTRISVRSGHGVGKSALISWIILWLLLTRQDVKIPLGAVTQNQLRDVNMPEIRKWASHLPDELAAQVEIQGERVFVKALPEMAFSVVRTCSKENPTALQGFHAKHLAFILDEASGIPDIVFETAIGALSTPGAIMILFGNPNYNSGYFYETHHKNRDDWWTLRVSCEDVPRAMGHIEQVIKEYGRESNAYKVRVLGDFPDADDETLIGLSLIEAAVDRDVEPMGVMPVWGLDPARMGSDRSALCKRRGNTLMEKVKIYNQRDTMTLAGLIVREWDETPIDDRPHEICIDVIGIGAGVYDRLDELGLPVAPVNVSESPSVDSTFVRLRDELWDKARKWFEARDCRIVPDSGLIAELSSVRYGFTSAGKLKVESKDDMKRRGMRSPDIADSFVITFAADDRQRMRNENDRHRRKSAPSTSPWAA